MQNKHLLHDLHPICRQDFITLANQIEDYFDYDSNCRIRMGIASTFVTPNHQGEMYQLGNTPFDSWSSPQQYGLGTLFVPFYETGGRWCWNKCYEFYHVLYREANRIGMFKPIDMQYHRLVTSIHFDDLGLFD